MSPTLARAKPKPDSRGPPPPGPATCGDSGVLGAGAGTRPRPHTPQVGGDPPQNCEIVIPPKNLPSPQLGPTEIPGELWGAPGETPIPGSCGISQVRPPPLGAAGCSR
ncbi:hypothetical protein DV515_00017471 [Chloebia gouldiae]|uniref:Uncharacterized protein n=1 Tax=Chloebia gouldiae TaxID=44316 RepID=A0A3L8QB59_CHLGU|nr:hypothetical protein DV515_00017471 [Chloebia gouldiae]